MMTKYPQITIYAKILFIYRLIFLGGELVILIVSLILLIFHWLLPSLCLCLQLENVFFFVFFRYGFTDWKTKHDHKQDIFMKIHIHYLV